jgi:hypothetical protein
MLGLVSTFLLSKVDNRPVPGLLSFKVGNRPIVKQKHLYGRCTQRVTLDLALDFL